MWANNMYILRLLRSAKSGLKNMDIACSRFYHDHVPWHNNNAEHAIHAFARYRRFADGRFTVKSIKDYLAILTVF